MCVLCVCEKRENTIFILIQKYSKMFGYCDKYPTVSQYPIITVVEPAESRHGRSEREGLNTIFNQVEIAETT